MATKSKKTNTKRELYQKIQTKSGISFRKVSVKTSPVKKRKKTKK